MPSWNEVLVEINECPRIDRFDFIRKKYLATFAEATKRNVIAIYSGFLQRPTAFATSITDDDKNGLMATVHKLDRSKGLDLILHTPGGEVAATESIVDYLRKMFGTDIRAFIPHMAMSAGTMIACACKEIVMGKESCIGPIDPQFGGIPAQGVIEEFKRAISEIKKDPETIPIWQVIVGKYHPTFLGECQHAVELSERMVADWLNTGMFAGDPDADNKSKAIVSQLNDHHATKSHSRHLSMEFAQSIGLKVSPLETIHGNAFQDIALTVHHTYMHSFANTKAIKIIENHTGNSIIWHAQ